MTNRTVGHRAALARSWKYDQEFEQFRVNDPLLARVLLGKYSSVADVARNVAIFRDAVEAKGEQWDPVRVGVPRAFYVTDDSREREEALERRLANRLRQLKLATAPDGRVLSGPDRADDDPVEINLNSAICGPFRFEAENDRYVCPACTGVPAGSSITAKQCFEYDAIAYSNIPFRHT